jgi:hypothetical protein
MSRFDAIVLVTVVSMLTNLVAFTLLFSEAERPQRTEPPVVINITNNDVVKPEPKVVLYTEKQVRDVMRVICGEVGPHHEDTGRNVLQVIVNRALLKSKHSKRPMHNQIVIEATKRIKGVPQFATNCRADGHADWQDEIVREALSGETDISNAAWISKDTLWFRTHVGAHKWETGKGWSRNINRSGSDEYHTFFDGNKQAIKFMTRY